MVEPEAQGEVGRGGPQTQVGQMVGGGLYLCRIILTNVGAHGCSAIGVKDKKQYWQVSEAENVQGDSDGGD